ncbi:DMT family transporter [Geitlerinema sp. PCC 9228]|uniref:DMT family transporter n=1 Tax=Geitlerinema sp. PCC 9228 TaxID=111611 RepID=UPI000A6F24C4|nr:DMT family transporter [Geitlerinema sp. PCC 9228]
MAKKPPAATITAIIVIGLLAVSTSAVLIRLAFDAYGARNTSISLLIAASRLTVAAAIWLPVAKNRRGGSPMPALTPWHSGWIYTALAGVFLAAHFAAWIASLAYTSIAASTTIVTSNPIWVALISWLWFREKPTAVTTLGIAIAVAGGAIVAQGDASSVGSHPAWGNFLALLGSWCVSGYLLLGRQAQRQGMPFSGYIAVAYTTAALCLLPIPPLLGLSYIGNTLEFYFYILALALLPQLVGHTSFNWAVRWVSPTWVTLVILFEPVLASLLGYFFFQEVPSVWVLLGAMILLVGVAIAVAGQKPSR